MGSLDGNSLKMSLCAGRSQGWLEMELTLQTTIRAVDASLKLSGNSALVASRLVSRLCDLFTS